MRVYSARMVGASDGLIARQVEAEIAALHAAAVSRRYINMIASDRTSGKNSGISYPQLFCEIAPR
jgi:hypothetical protein